MTIIDQLNAKMERDRASDAEVARIVGMTVEEYDADVTRLDHADDQGCDDTIPDTPPDLCLNCRCYGVEDPYAAGEFYCVICGNEWNTHEPMPDIP
jgi:hypothetical protein